MFVYPPKRAFAAMGIRFLCPNGHRLNVKQELAGKRGVCPDCDARFEIPLASTIPSRREEAAALAAGGEPDEAPESAAEIVEEAEPQPAVVTEPPAAAPPAAEIVWYVELPSGERLGPADPGTMRGWLEEGRAAPDSLVWRTGWEEWQPVEAAQRAFDVTVGAPSPAEAPPAEASPAAASAAAASAAEAPATAAPSADAAVAEEPATASEPSGASAVIPVEEPSVTAPAAAVRNRRQQQKQRRKQATVLLTALVLVLGLVLVVVISL